MKKFQVLAILSATALSGAIAFSAANSAVACPFSELGGSKSATGSTFPASGSDKMNPRNKAAIAFTGLAGLLALGAGYMSCRAGQQAKAACAAMTDSFDDIEDSEEIVADELVYKHPEAPGGELDLVVQEVVSVDTVEKEVAIAK